ncbi:conserved hypothetical protein [Culex quinquefasciatus]|uniref:Uncharacterized protein n=1 Tax=Culex quinquefasciatus TaxID=7176 RepID=B0X276_CULQU|nr:conserved hypothetical protein [Culex quinquefasciatus]|eukprot:XP_001863748.1 conserved hypothetical protein [Culex quinquefasciatus]
MPPGHHLAMTDTQRARLPGRGSAASFRTTTPTTDPTTRPQLERYEEPRPQEGGGGGTLRRRGSGCGTKMSTNSPGTPKKCRLILQQCLAIQLTKPGHPPEDFWMYDSGYTIFQVAVIDQPACVLLADAANEANERPWLNGYGVRFVSEWFWVRFPSAPIEKVKDIEMLEMLNMNEKSKSLEAGFEPPSFGMNFLSANLQCWWNAPLAAATKVLRYLGHISPGMLLITAEPCALEIIRSAYARSVLKPPATYLICSVGKSRSPE